MVNVEFLVFNISGCVCTEHDHIQPPILVFTVFLRPLQSFLRVLQEEARLKTSSRTRDRRKYFFNALMSNVPIKN
jgi:hypothetical protein